MWWVSLIFLLLPSPLITVPSVLKVTLRRGYMFQIFCHVWQRCLVLWNCHVTRFFAAVIRSKLMPSLWQPLPPFILFSSCSFCLSSMTQISRSRSLRADTGSFFFPLLWLTTTHFDQNIHWHQLPKTINMLRSVSLTFPMMNQTVPLTFCSYWITFHR